MQRWLPTLAITAAATLAIVVLWLWLTASPPPPVMRMATAEGSLAEARATPKLAAVNLEGTFRGLAHDPAAPSSSWPCFRGPQRDNVAAYAAPLLETWPTNGPPLLWQMTLGEGHAAPAVHRGRVYLLDYDETRGGDVLRCLDLHTGREQWQRFYAVRTKRNHGISRTIPAVDDQVVVTLGPQCHVLCAASADGAFRWGMNLVSRFGTQVPLWWAGQCPLLDAGEAVLAPAGREALLIGVDVACGAVKWQTPNPDGWSMSHASVMVITAEGQRQFVYAALGGITGVAADGPERGRLLWRTSAFAPSVVAPSPVPLPGGRFFMTAGYGSGGAMFRVARSNDAWQASILFRTDRRTFGCEQQTPVFRNDMLFTVLPGDAGEHRQEFAAMDLEGHACWTSGPTSRFGLGPYLAIGSDRFLLLDDSGVLSLMAADRNGCRLLARADVMSGKGRDAWGPMALVDGLLLLRDSTRLYCLDVRATGSDPARMISSQSYTP